MPSFVSCRMYRGPHERVGGPFVSLNAWERKLNRPLDGQVRATVSIVKRRLPTPLQCNVGREVNAVYHAGLGIMLPLARSIRWKIKQKSHRGKSQKVVCWGMVLSDDEQTPSVYHQLAPPGPVGLP